MVIINGETFYEKPGSCGTCPFLYSGSSNLCHFDTGHCQMFDEIHHTWRNPPSRCQKLFNKAFKMPEGSKLVIVRNEE